MTRASRAICLLAVAVACFGSGMWIGDPVDPPRPGLVASIVPKAGIAPGVDRRCVPLQPEGNGGALRFAIVEVDDGSGDDAFAIPATPQARWSVGDRVRIDPRSCSIVSAQRWPDG